MNLKRGQKLSFKSSSYFFLYYSSNCCVLNKPLYCIACRTTGALCKLPLSEIEVVTNLDKIQSALIEEYQLSFPVQNKGVKNVHASI